MEYKAYRDNIIELAERSIQSGLQHGEPCVVELETLPQALRENGASFITLHKRGQLRGCIGSLEAKRPLATDISDNAYAAAFRDPRFSPLHKRELGQLSISISILTPAEEMDFVDEADLLEQIRPGIDGLILQDKKRRGTFLPSVWESLPDKRDFLTQLKRKAGLPVDHWSKHIRVWRYRTEKIE